ncbi:LysR family transcriptional regulator [Burkholderiaceae bacterium FT117]|uniref:LysR family transcriptional regulator n=1 Tax=Zeimonas sediminis TaxID=2944268 RepID=UPI002342DF51|nr:LysR family transcriptional regulator [Zeimonas sediminis]MCM5569458.1 LysR family transcriptional regulator [Zeimonas sediminis]
MDRFTAMNLYTRVVETGSFSRAADEFAMGQPTVSKQIAALERRLGVRLLERSTRRLRTTEAGREYYERCRRLLEEVDALESSVSADADAVSGRIRVACPMAFGRLYVAPVVIAFMAEHPQATIDLVMNDRYVDLVEEGVDLSIRIVRPSADSLLHARKLGEVHRSIVASPAYLRRNGTPREPEQLAAHPFALFPDFADPEILSLRRGDERRRIRVRGSLKVNNAEVMLEAARAGLGLASLPLWCVGGDLERGSLKRVLPQWEPAHSVVYAVYSSARYMPRRVRVFTDFLARRLAMPTEWPKEPGRGE